MKATWSEDSDCNSNDEEKKVANMCFVAIESRNEVYSSDNETNPSYDELNVTTPIFLHSFSRYFGNFQVNFFFFCDIQVPSKFLPKFRQSLPYTGRSQVIGIDPVYTSNISHLITQNHDPIILGLNPTHYHQHNTSYSITSYNIVQMKDSISTINMHGQIGTKSLNH